jgi:hypothetical protein
MEYKGFFFHISTAQSSNWKGWRVQRKQQSRGTAEERRYGAQRLGKKEELKIKK